MFDRHRFRVQCGVKNIEKAWNEIAIGWLPRNDGMFQIVETNMIISGGCKTWLDDFQPLVNLFQVCFYWLILYMNELRVVVVVATIISRTRSLWELSCPVCPCNQSSNTSFCGRSFQFLSDHTQWCPPSISGHHCTATPRLFENKIGHKIVLNCPMLL